MLLPRRNRWAGDETAMHQIVGYPSTSLRFARNDEHRARGGVLFVDLTKRSRCDAGKRSANDIGKKSGDSAGEIESRTSGRATPGASFGHVAKGNARYSGRPARGNARGRKHKTFRSRDRS